MRGTGAAVGARERGRAGVRGWGGQAGTRPAGQRGAEPAPIPLPRAGSPRVSPSGPRAAAGARERGADLGAPKDPGLRGRPRERVRPLCPLPGPRIPEAALDGGR